MHIQSLFILKASFYIWLARNSSAWPSNTSLITIEDTNFPAAGSKNINPYRDSPSSSTAFLSSQPTRNQRKCDQETKHPGFFSKGKTCYENSILQALGTIPSFWCQSHSGSGFLSHLTRAVTLNMSPLKRRTTALNPSNFLWALSGKLSTNKQIPFHFNIQQDVPEILQVVHHELVGHSTIANNILATPVRTSTTCTTCGCCNIEEVKSISMSLDISFFWKSGWRQQMVWPSNIVDSGSVLILQLLHYDNFKGDRNKK